MSSDARKIVVTGASRGLGLAMAAGFIDAGHTVFGCARSQQAIVGLRERWPAPHRFDVVDVTHDEAVRVWAEAVLAEAGPPDLLINSAGVINENAPLWNISAAEFSHVIDVNIKGPANVIRHFVPAMVEKSSGVIVNFSSGWGRSVAPEVAPYCATKWAIEGMTQALAEELPEGMAAVSFNPGTINTDMLQKCFAESASSYPSPERWARSAVPCLLAFGPQDNGRPASVFG